MIYFENHNHGRCGLNNHLIPYTLSIAISNFLERPFYFAYEVQTSIVESIEASGRLKSELEHVINGQRGLISDLLDIPNRRVYEIDRNVAKKTSVEDPLKTYITNRDQHAAFGSTMISDFFSLGRTPVIKEELDEFDLVEFGRNILINASYYFFLDRNSKAEVLDSIKIRYREEYESLAEKITSQLGNYNALHLRMGDFEIAYSVDGFKVETDLFAEYLRSVYRDSDLPVLVASDSFQRREVFQELLGGFRYRFIDEILLGDFFEEFKSLPFCDLNVLGLMNQLICSASNRFAGTCRSTFTSVIHRLRQERYGKTDFSFFPDARVRRHIDSNFVLVPDSSGFFEWNRYSAFSEHYEYPAWVREWNYELTAI